ncbi:dihydroorotase [Halapricum desulfuricans]|uniref:Dihydroorotase n=1 Tax=Halapricum desulfuricans TaxID=2841257 RepID=A0A897NVD9_9EURY|nr:dihydroorotase [Halapricum desulfuricans]QSG15515.1 Dihydroorotase or related cyclic amidohydrolase [Halapricum desulfuricans]
MLITGATLPDGRTRDVRIEDETVAEIGEMLSTTAEERSIDASGKRLLPGMIDVHVHFRQPGYGHKETWASGSKSAAAGGVTTVVDQPNTDPPTIDGEHFDQKSKLAADSLVDFGINGGVTDKWQPEELFDRPLFALGEVFLADSTGNMGIDADLFADAVARASERGVTVTVHAEDATRFNDSARERDDADAWSAYRTPQAEIDAVRRACTVANDHDARIHVAHTSTPEAIDIAVDAGMTCEVTPHHLFLSRDDLPELGTFGRMNPPLRRENRRRKVFERVVDGTVDMIATDHAPHTRDEKDASIWEAPSGVPGVETALPLLLNEAREGNLSYERVRDLTAANPAAVFGLSNKGRIEEGFDADLVLVDPDDPRPVRGEETHTNCEWTPFEGMDAVFPELTMVRGTVVYENRHEELFGEPVGENVRSA